MKIVYIAHPISGDIEGNLAKIRKVVKSINLEYSHIVPFVPYYADVVSLDDTDSEQRARGIQNDHRLLPLAQEVWLFGDWRKSSGCCVEVRLALDLGIPVFEVMNSLRVMSLVSAVNEDLPHA